MGARARGGNGSPRFHEALRRAGRDPLRPRWRRIRGGPVRGVLGPGRRREAGVRRWGLVFEPAEVTIKAGETVNWVNNRGFPHNIVFDEDDVPGGVNAEALSNEDLMNAAGDKHSAKFTVAGEYGYYCEPHQGAGMVGRVIVN